MIHLEHYRRCTADYPEKVEGEAPKQLEAFDVGWGQVVVQCVDCGAHTLIPKPEGFIDNDISSVGEVQESLKV